MVYNVVFDDTMEDVTSDEAKLTVNSRQRALHICPIICLVVRCFWMCVVEVGDCD